MLVEEVPAYAERLGCLVRAGRRSERRPGENPRYEQTPAQTTAAPRQRGTGRGTRSATRERERSSRKKIADGRAILFLRASHASPGIWRGRAGVHTHTIKTWHVAGLLVGHKANDKNERLYKPPTPGDPRLVKRLGRPLGERQPVESTPGGAV